MEAKFDHPYSSRLCSANAMYAPLGSLSVAGEHFLDVSWNKPKNTKRQLMDWLIGRERNETHFNENAVTNRYSDGCAIIRFNRQFMDCRMIYSVLPDKCWQVSRDDGPRSQSKSVSQWKDRRRFPINKRRNNDKRKSTPCRRITNLIRTYFPFVSSLPVFLSKFTLNHIEFQSVCWKQHCSLLTHVC